MNKILLLVSLLFCCLTGFSQAGATLNFNGSNNYVEKDGVGSLPTGNAARTVEAWIKTTNHADESIVNYGDAISNNRFGILVQAAGNIYFVGEFNDMAGTAIVNDGNWHHIAAVYTGGSNGVVSLYVDGVLNVSSTKNLNTTSTALRIGQRLEPDNGELFNGNIDEVRIWNRALTACEINTNMHTEISSPQAGLVAYYQFDEGIAGGANTGITTLTDISGNNLNGTLYNFTLSGTTSNWVTPGAVVTGSLPSLPAGVIDNITACYTYTWINGVTYTSNNDSATYQYTGSNGCDSVVTLNLTIIPDSSLTGSGATSNAPLCGQSTLNLSATGGISWSWTGPNAFTSTAQNPTINNVTQSSVGEYHVKITGTTGCQISDSLVVRIGPVPDATILPPGIDTICPGTSVMLGTQGFSGLVHAPGATGTNTICSCPAGYVAVGYESRHGGWLDQFTLACKQLNSDGSLGTNVVYTTSNGVSTGGGADGPYFFPGNDAMTGIAISSLSNSFFSGVQGYAQSTSAILADSSNVTNSVAGPFMGSSNSNTTMLWAPDGSVITGMVSWEDNYYASGLAIIYTPIGNLLTGFVDTFAQSYTWSTGATSQSITVSSTGAYTLTVQNSAGCTSISQPVQVNVVNQPPSIVCFGDTTLYAPSYSNGVNFSFTPPTYGLCAPYPVSSNPSSGSFFPIGTTNVTNVATDALNDSASCSFNVIVLDTVAPVIACPQPLVVPHDSGTCSAVVNFSPPQATDNSMQGSSVYFSYTGGVQQWTVPSNVYAVSIQATGALGWYDSQYWNQGGGGTQVQTTLNVTPGEVLYLTIGGYSPYDDGTGGYNGGGNASYDNNGNSGGGGGGQTNIGTTGNVLTDTLLVAAGGGGAGFDCGNDQGGNGGDPNGYPGLDCGNNDGGGATQTAGGIGLNNGSYMQGANGNPNSNDGGGGGGGYYGGGAGNLGGGGGGSSYVTPVGSSNTVYYAGNNYDNGWVNINYQPTITTVQTGGLPSGSVFPGGSSVVTFTATDSSGNSSTCNMTVIVADTNAPVISCPGNITVGTAPYSCGATVSFNVTATGGCSSAYTVVSNPPSGYTFPVGTTSVSNTAINYTGDTSICIFNVTVIDSNPPSLNCPGDITVNNDPGNCGAVVSFTPPTASYTCSPVVTFNYAPQVQQWTVPAGIDSVMVQAIGASGSQDDYYYEQPGAGALVQTTLYVTPGEVLYVRTGGYSASGAGGYNGGGAGSYNSQGYYGGGGGGQTSIGSTGNILTDTLVVAAGGGGSAAYCGYDYGGNGGDPNGYAGLACGGNDGGGATQTAGGGGLNNGSYLQGGSGNLNANVAGGGGGGYYGGGSGSVGGGGGGSSFVSASFTSNTTYTSGYNYYQPGSVTITYTPSVVVTQTTGLPPGSAFPLGTTLVTYNAQVQPGNSSSCSFYVNINNPSGATYATICQGSSYNLNGRILTQTGIYTDSVTTSNNCDSAVVLNLTVTPADTSSFSQTICGGAYTFNGVALTTSGIYIDTFLTTGGCDSIVTLTLTVYPAITSSFSQTICAGQTYMFNGIALSTAGSYNDTLQSINSCDSIVTLNLTLNPVVTSSLHASICMGNNYNFNGILYTQAGTYTDTLTGSNACDSIVTLILTVDSLPTVTITPSGPDSICLGSSVTLSAGNDFSIRVNDSITGNTAFVNASAAGGSQTTCNCPPGYVVVGYEGRTGSWSDQFSLACKKLNSNGSLDPNVVYTCSDGSSTGGGPRGPYIFPGNTAMVGINATNGCDGYLSGVQGFGQSTAYIGSDGSNSALPVVGNNEIGGCNNGSLGTVFVPNGNVAIGMISWNTRYSSGVSLVYAPLVMNLGEHFLWSTGDTVPFISATNGGFYTVTVTDSNLCSGTSAPVQVVVDTIATIVSCGGDVIDTLPAGQCSTTVHFPVPVITGSPAPVFTYSPDSTTVFGIGTTTVTLTAVNSCGTATCTFNVTIVDTVAPVITCPGNMIVASDPSNCGAAVNYNVTATDQCGWVNVVSSPASGSFLPTGTTTVVSTATDFTGNVSVCSFTVTVADSTPPTIAGCPGNITVSADSGSCGAIVNFNAPVATDNCTGFSFVSFAYTGGYQTWTVPANVTSVNIDAAGGAGGPDNNYYQAGGSGARVQTTLAVTPGEVLYINVAGGGSPFNAGYNGGGIPSNDGFGDSGGGGGGFTAVGTTGNMITDTLVIAAGGGGSGIDCGSGYDIGGNGGDPDGYNGLDCGGPDGGGATQGSGGNSNVEYGSFMQGGNGINYNYTNGGGGGGGYYGGGAGYYGGGGGGSSYVASTDVSNTTYTAGYNNNGNGYVNISFSQPFSTTQTSGLASGSSFPVGTTVVTFTAADSSNNIATCSFTVTVIDTTAPVISCPGNIIVASAPDMCSAAVAFNVTATDNCSFSIVSSPASGSNFPLGVTTVTSTATDSSGNTSACSFTVTVIDTTAPVIACPADIQTTAISGQCEVPVSFSVTATDNCSGTVSIVSRPASGSMFPIGTTSVTSIATDSSGNSSSCIFNVTVTPLPNLVSATICANESYNVDGILYSQAGTYTDTLTGTNGCDSIVTLTLTVNPVLTSSFAQSICSGTSYNFNGTSVSAAGSYNDTLQTVNGCDSIVTLTLTVNPVLTSSFAQSICAGTSYNFNGTNVSAAGSYNDTLQTVNGCDSIVTLTLTVNPVLTSSFAQSICSGTSYNFNGLSVSAAGSYNDTLQTVNGCDSIVTLTLTVNPVLTSSFAQSICSGTSYNFNGTSVSAAGSYNDTLQTVNGCDSIVTLTLTVNPVLTSSFAQSICTGTSYNFNGTNVSAAGSYNDTLQTVNGCDSIVTLTLTVNPVLTSSFAQSICSGTSYNFNGTSVSAAGSYNDTLQTVNGCDSIVTLTLTVNPVLTSSFAQSICSGTSYNFNGTSVSAAGSYNDTLQTVNGCDSIVTLTLTVNPVLTSSFAQSICSGTSYNFNGTSVSAAGSYNDTLQTVNGCDSIVTLTLTVNPVLTSSFAQSICSGTSYNFNGTSVSAAGSYNDTLQTVNGCDSIVTLTLTVNPVLTSSFAQSICSGTSYNFNGLSVSAAGSYNDTLQTVNGCDSIVTLTLTVNPVLTSSFAQSICSGTSYNFNGTSVSAAGSYNDTLQTVNGCDSIVTLTLTVNPVLTSSFAQSICSGTSYNFNGVSVSTAGNYNDTLQTVNGCDSIVTLTLTVNPVLTSSFAQSICSGTSYNFNGTSVSAAGSYNDTLQTVNGCDSIVTLTLTVNPVLTSSFAQSICSGTSYNFNGTSVSAAGSYNDTLQTVNGCDSIVTLTLTVNPVLTSSFAQSICSGTSYNFNGVSVSTAGNYNDTLQTVNGCDSIVTLTLTVNPVLTSSFAQSICSGTSYNFNGTSVSAAGSYNDTLQTVNGCDSIVTLTLTVNPVLTSSFAQSICSGTSYNFNGTSVSAAGSYNDTLQTVNGCDSIVTLTLTVNPVLTSSFAQSICSGTSYNFNGVSVTSAGSYNDTLQTVNGCDSIVTLTLTVNPVLTSSFAQSICSGTSYNFNGVSVSTAGSYNDTLQTVNGCDSIVTLTLTVNPVLTSSFAQSICSGTSYNFNGTSVSAAGSYNDTLQTVNGCDSIVTLALTVNPVLTSSFAQSICAGTSYNFNGTSVSAAGSYNDTLQTVNGCDSIVTLTLTVNPVLTSSFAQSICSGTSYNFNGTSVSAAGSYNDTLQTVNGCDSIVTLTLTVNPVLTSSFAQSICSGTSYNFNGTSVSAAGSYNDTLQTVNGCDSIVTLTLTVNPVLTSSFAQSICSGTSYNFNGTSVSAAGSYNDTLQTVNGCDSIVTLTLTVNPVLTSSFAQSICTGTSYNFNGTNVSAAGSYNDTLHTVNGCDSIVTLVLTVNPAVTTSITQNICAGSSYNFNGTVYAQAGTYRDTLLSVNGCDSIIVLTLSVNPIPVLNFAPQLLTCVNNTDVEILAGNPGSTYLWSTGSQNEAITVTTSGTYSVTVTTGLGCSASDSTAVVFNPNPVIPIVNYETICNGTADTLNAENAGSTYLWSNSSTSQTITVTGSGIYSVTITNGFNCSATGSFDASTQTVTVPLNGTVSTCIGEAITLDAGNAGSTYQWSDNSTGETITTAAPGQYSVTVTSPLGCTGSGSTDITTINPGPVSLNLGMHTVCSNIAADTLSGGTPAGGSYSGESVTGNIFHPSSIGTGRYPITYTVTDSGCSASAVDTITTTTCVDIAEVNGTMQVELYPNPSNGNFELDILNDIEYDFSIDVIDVDGRKIVQTIHQSANGRYVKMFDLSSLAKGVYFVRIITDQEMIVKRIVLQ